MVTDDGIESRCVNILHSLTWKFWAGREEVVGGRGGGGDDADDGAVLGEAGVGRPPRGHRVDAAATAAAAPLSRGDRRRQEKLRAAAFIRPEPGATES